MRVLLRPLSYIYGWLADLHRQAYQKSILKSVGVGKPVVSIGNLTVGGTGKTPFVLKLVKELEDKSLRPAVVVRSYKGSVKASHEMSLEDTKYPAQFGDEACVYKIKNPQLRVFTGSSKFKSAWLASCEKDIDIILVDDGFQHHKLEKNWNGILLDATKAYEWKLLPEGRLREGFKNLKYADAIFLTRVDLVSEVVIDKIKKYLPDDKPVFLMTTKFKRLRSFDGKVVEKSLKRVGLVCALGNPKQFEDFFKKHYPQTTVIPFFYRDHHNYESLEVGYLETEIARKNLDLLVTTEKDEIKLKKHIAKPNSWAVVDIESQFVNEEEWKKYWDKKLYELVGSSH